MIRFYVNDITFEINYFSFQFNDFVNKSEIKIEKSIYSK